MMLLSVTLNMTVDPGSKLRISLIEDGIVICPFDVTLAVSIYRHSSCPACVTVTHRGGLEAVQITESELRQPKAGEKERNREYCPAGSGAPGPRFLRLSSL
jgi:hypothetical protein